MSIGYSFPSLCNEHEFTESHESQGHLVLLKVASD